MMDQYLMRDDNGDEWELVIRPDSGDQIIGLLREQESGDWKVRPRWQGNFAYPGGESNTATREECLIWIHRLDAYTQGYDDAMDGVENL